MSPPEQHDIEHYAWLDDDDDTRGLEREINTAIAYACGFAVIFGLAVWWAL